jgi:glycogen synthase
MLLARLLCCCQQPRHHPSSHTLTLHLTPHHARAALDRAFRHYKEQPQDWQQLRQRIMSDAGRWSWDTAAGSYVQLYQQVTMQV